MMNATVSRATRWLRNPWLVGPVGLLMVASWMSAYAAWTDSVQASTTSSAGSVDITANGQDVLAALTDLNLTGLLPGATAFAPLTIRNAGTTAVTYSMSTASSGVSVVDKLLASALQLGVTVVSGSTCDQAAFSSGTVLQPLAADLNQASFTNRPLAAGSSETLCFKQVLPLSAPATLMSKTTNTLFTFTATGA